MSTRKAKLTKKLVDSLTAGDTVWDTDVAGFGVRCQKKRTSYILKKRFRGGQRFITIGKHGEPWTVEKARRKALSYIVDISDGIDPAKEKKSIKDQPTVKYLLERYLDDHAREHKKVHSVRSDEGMINNHILPLLGKEFVVDVSDMDIDRFKKAVKSGKTAAAGGTKAVKGGPVIANRCLALLSKAFNLSIRWKWRTDNPVAFVTKYKEEKKERYLSEKEFAALFDGIQQEEAEGGNVYALAALRLLVMTGARHGEIVGLRWSEVDFDNCRLNLPDSKTGKKSILLSPPALEIITNVPRVKNNPHVICGTKEGSHMINIRKTWMRVKGKATRKLIEQSEHDDEIGLMDVRIHDLRHSFASIAAASGMPLLMIGKLLGHSQVATTARYAHLADDPMQQANDLIGSRLQGLMERKKEDNVVKFK